MEIPRTFPARRKADAKINGGEASPVRKTVVRGYNMATLSDQTPFL